MRELIKIKSRFSLRDYHNVKFAIGNSLENEKISFYSNLENDIDDVALHTKDAFVIKDCNTLIDLEHQQLHVEFILECTIAEVYDIFVVNYKNIILDFIEFNNTLENIQEDKPTMGILWMQYEFKVKENEDA